MGVKMDRNILSVGFNITLGVGFYFLLLSTGCGKEESYYQVSDLTVTDPTNSTSTTTTSTTTTSTTMTSTTMTSTTKTLPLPSPPDCKCDKDKNGNDKVYVCHTESSQKHELCISLKALPAHLAHGDVVGECL